MSALSALRPYAPTGLRAEPEFHRRFVNSRFPTKLFKRTRNGGTIK